MWMNKWYRLALFVLLLSLFYCRSYEEAEEFYESRLNFEDNWWFSNTYGVCLLVDSYKDSIIFDSPDGVYSTPYIFEAPNLYHVDEYGYTAKVYQNEQCYDIVISILSETVCECGY